MKLNSLFSFSHILCPIVESIKSNENELDLSDISDLITLAHRNSGSVAYYTIPLLCNVALEKLRKAEKFNYFGYNSLMTSLISSSYIESSFWKEFLKYLKLYEIKRFDDFVMLKSNITLLEEKTNQSPVIVEAARYLEIRYEKQYNNKAVDKL